MSIGARLSVLVAMCVVVAGGMAGLVSPAQAQETFPATVTSVVDGDTVDAQVAGGPTLRVRLIGIDTPERGECGTDQATAYMEELALGRNVTLVSDPTQDRLDSFGRSLFYVDRDDGRDVGLAMVRAGWAQVVRFGRDFQRLSAYYSPLAEAQRFGYGVWGRCGGDFRFSRAEELRERRFSAIAFMRRYYRWLSNNQFAAAWGMLARRVRRDFGPFASWKAGYRRSLGTTVTAARARLSGRRAVVSVCRHERALAVLFGEVLRLCDRAGLVKPGVVSIDGTRIAGNASPEVNYEFDRIAREIVAEARATDAAEDELYGEARGDELPERLRTPDGRREFFRQARQQLRNDDPDAEELDEEPKAQAAEEVPLELDAARIVARTQGREGWSREGKRQLEQHRWRHHDPIPRSRRERLLVAAERLQADLDVEWRANEAYEHYRATARDRLGRRPGGRADPYRPPEVPAGKVNVTDPDSRSIPVGFGFVQGYNAQAAVNEQQIVLAAEITNNSTDFSQLDPMVTATFDELERAGIEQLPEAVAADAGYWNEQHMDEVTANKHIPVLIPPDKGSRGTPRRGWSGGRYAWMRNMLATEHGRRLYRKRKQTVEPLFGNTKHNSGVYRFHRRGRVKVRTEWRLLMLTHNLTKLHRHRLATVGA